MDDSRSGHQARSSGLGPFRQLADGLSFPEGPVALSGDDIVVVEMGAGRITRIDKSGIQSTVAIVGAGPNGSAVGPDGALYVANNGGFRWTERGGRRVPLDYETHTNEPDEFGGGWIERVDLESGAVKVLYTEFEGKALRGPNDLVFDASGGMWFTDHGKVRRASVDRGALYYATVDGRSIRRVAFPLLGPNGVGLSPLQDVVYVAETLTGRIWQWRLIEPGRIESFKEDSNVRRGGRCLIALPWSLDSLAVEADGNLVVAALGEGLCVVSPEGDLLDRIAIPGDMATNLCFRGRTMSQAIITLSGSGRLVECDWPRSGLPTSFNR